MLSFRNFYTLNESIRQGLPHITTMDHNQLHDLIKSGHVHFHDVTEKTDGQTFKFGHDENGFYSQSSGSGSEKMRTGDDYVRRATERGNNPEAANAFKEIHDSLHKNQALTDHLRNHFQKHGSAEVRGEVFSRRLSTPSEVKGEVKPGATSYDPSRWGSKGQIVLHTKLPENEHHDPEHFKKNLSNSEVNFENDKIEHKKSKVDVRDELEDFKKLNHTLLASRTTKTNKEAKEAEKKKLAEISNRVSSKVDEHIKSKNLSPKFGSGTEGAVIHPHNGSPRFKVTSDAFRKYREKVKSGEVDTSKFKRKITESIVYRILNEGGNIKIKTPHGDISAAPFKVRKRTEQATDFHNTLMAMHDAFHAKHKQELFKNKRVPYTGSSRHFADTQNITDEEFKKHKPSVGDVDVQVSQEHKEKLDSILKPGTRFGSHTVVGTKKHGNEISVVVRHDNGEHHQIDFQGIEGGPSKDSEFLHSADWEDTKKGIKGAHHKILLNAIGGASHKFSITHGLRSRTDESDPGTKNPEKISRKLFGNKADHSKIHSFRGISELIRDHIPKERHQEIYDKFKSSTGSVKAADHSNALEHLRKTLGVKDTLSEAVSSDTEHAHISFMGAEPFTHMGHHIDVVGSMGEGKKFIGLSGKSQEFSDKERADISNKQSRGKVQFKVERSAGETVGRAFNSLNSRKRRVLHLHFGHDRKEFAERLKSSILQGKIPELKGQRPDEVHIHLPSDKNRSHGMSGTKLRQSAAAGDLTTFHKHLGPSFSRVEARKLMDRVSDGIKSGKIPLIRKE